MNYYLVERQSGGCDYTIGCGIRVTKLNATSKSEAMEEAAENIGGAWGARHEYSIDSAQLLEVSEYFDLADFLNQKAKERDAAEKAEAQAEQEKSERAEFDRLSRKFRA